MAESGTAAAQPTAVAGDPAPEEMVSTGEAARIIGKDPRTVERWVDAGKLRGGRPSDPETREPIAGSHRWVDVRHAVWLAAGSKRGHLVPPQWRHLLPRQPSTGPAGT